MACTLFTRINTVLQRFEQTFALALGRRFPPDAFAIVGVEINRAQPTGDGFKKEFSLKDILGDGFLWAVPKHRRSLEKRLKRKYGHTDYIMKILLPKKDLRTCNVCGDDHERGVMCPTCYKKVITETKEMQDAIQKELQLEPVEKEVVILYDGEKDTKPDEFFDGKRIVEMNKPRPEWFSKNLLQQTTQKPATTKDVKPSELG